MEHPDANTNYSPMLPASLKEGEENVHNQEKYPLLVPYILVDFQGKPYCGLSVDQVSLTVGATVSKLRDEVLKKNKVELRDYVPARLQVYKKVDDIKEKKSLDPLSILKCGSNSDLFILLVPNSVHTATLQFFEWGNLSAFFYEHKINVRAGFQLDKLEMPNGGFQKLYVLEGSSNSKVMLEADSSGRCTFPFEGFQIYRIQVKRANSVDIIITFSGGKLNINTLRQDFCIKTEEGDWVLDKVVGQRAPESLIDLVDCSINFGSARLETSRREIVSLFLKFALREFRGKSHKYWMEPESSFEVLLPNRTRPWGLEESLIQQAVEYRGKADYAIGHSEDDERERLAKDARVLVIEVKTEESWDKAYPQVLAQAATCLEIRRREKRGQNESGGPVFFIQTDGFTWKFGKLDAVDGTLSVVLSKKVRFSNSRGKEYDIENIQVIYSWLVYIVGQIYEASPRTSEEATADAMESLSITPSNFDKRVTI